MNPGAERITVTIQRPTQNTPWGFRLQGGADFTTPLSIQSVAPGSPADQYGVKSGDAVLAINNQPMENVAHDQAKQVIMMSGNHVAFVLERGSVTVWQPHVTPVDHMKPAQLNLNPSGPSPYQNDEPLVQRTSLAANQQESLRIGSAHNRSAKPFAGFGTSYQATPPAPAAPPAAYQPQPQQQQYQQPPQQQYQQPQQQQYQQPQQPQYSPQPPQQPQYSPQPPQQQGGPVNAQYNTPISLYSDQNRADIYQQQSQALSGGMQGSPGGYQEQPTSQFQPASGGQAPGGISGMRSVRAPTTKPPGERQQQQTLMRCNGCDTLITGIFVKIKGNPMHPECFKCATCGMNLKQQGYIEVGGRLYCEVHARQAAQQ